MTSELWHQCMVYNLCLWKANIHIFICILYHSLWTLKTMGGNPNADVGERANVWWEHSAGKETHPGVFLHQGLSSQPPWVWLLVLPVSLVPQRNGSDRVPAWHIVNTQLCQLILASVIIPCLLCTAGPIYINRRLNTMSIAPPRVVQEVAQEGLIHTGHRQSTVWMGVVQEVAQPLIPHSYSKQMCIECLPWARHCWELVIQPGAGRQGPCSDLLMSVFLFAKGG